MGAKKLCDYELTPPGTICTLVQNHDGIHLIGPRPKARFANLYVQIAVLNIWLHVNLPTIMPVVDRFFHLFGICLGH